MKRVAVLASGRGSNLSALLAAQDKFVSYRVVLVVSNVEGSGALALGRAGGLEAVALPSRGVDREQHERSILACLSRESIDLICLAGYLRVLGKGFLEAAPGPVLNIHPSLLPAFPGMHAQKQALEAGVRWSGATVHFVDPGLDTGPIVLQEPVRVEPDDSEESLSARILEVEHRIYPEAVDLVARGAYEIHGRTVRLARL